MYCHNLQTSSARVDLKSISVVNILEIADGESQIKDNLRFVFCIFCFLFCFLLPLDAVVASTDLTDNAGKVRIKDIAWISCIHDMQLYGYGLVVGLNGTGDSSGATFTVQSVINMMQQFGIDVPSGRISLRNVAAVMVTANLPFFAKVGGRIDVLVSSIGDAKSIAGGILLVTPLNAPDGQLYVLAQGSVSVGGFNVSAGGGNSVQKNHPTVGRVPNGGLIQRVPRRANNLYRGNEGFMLCLNEPDFTTATRVVSAINNEFPGDVPTAQAVDASSVKITVPALEQDLVTFISRLENLTVVPDHIAEVIIDERTGTIVIGKDVRISPVAVSHGNLNIQIRTEEEVVQPPLLAGETAVISKKELAVQEEGQKMQVIRGGTSIDEVVRALNLIGVTPRDMIIIFQAIKKAGALHARLLLM